MPGIALAETLSPDVTCVFMGTRNGMEAQLLAESGWPFIGMPSLPWVGAGLRQRLDTLTSLPLAVVQARRELRRLRASVLVSLGSSAALAPGLAAASLGLPVILYESNTQLGLANWALLPFADALLTSRLFQQTLHRGPRPEPIGVPLRASVRELAACAATYPDDEIRLLVLGGSLGNPFLNTRMPKIISRLGRKHPSLSVTHQCGRSIDPAPISQAYEAKHITATVHPFIKPITSALTRSHLVVATAGAITLHEIAAAGVPAVVVPLEKAAARHQHANASVFTSLTGCPQASESTWDDDTVVMQIHDLLGNRDRWQQCQRGLQQFSPVDSTRLAADAVHRFLKVP